MVHESRQSDLTTGNAVKAAIIFARTSRLLKETDPAVAKDYLARVAGLNSGWSKEEGDPWLSYSLVEGIGYRSWKGWSGIKGSAINGFSASPQFRIQPASAASNKPAYCDNEEYIAHSHPFLSTTAQLEQRPPLRQAAPCGLWWKIRKCLI